MTKETQEAPKGLYNKDIKLTSTHLAALRYLQSLHRDTPSGVIQRLLDDEMDRVHNS